jgi:Tir chaperone protein (CesT) family
MGTALQVLEKFSEVVNLEFSAGVVPDAWGALHLWIGTDRQVVISSSPDQSDLVFSTPLIELDRPTDTVLFTAALACNLHQETTRGGAIGLDPECQALTYSWRLPAERADPAMLLVCLHNFSETADKLADDIRANSDALTPEEREQIEEALDRSASTPSLSEKYMGRAPIL